MKNRKLYLSIQKLVNHTDPTKKTKQNFAQQYCNTQLKKKKLLPKHSTSKIDQLMKNFKSIKTYIDVDDLINCVNELYMEQEKQKKKQLVNDFYENKKVHQRKYQSQLAEPKILQKAKNTLKQYHQNFYEKQNQNIKGILSCFQDNSNYLCETMKNRQNFGFVMEFQRLEKKKLQNFKNNQQQNQKKWNSYYGAKGFVKTQPKENTNYQQTKRKQTQNNYKKKRRLFQLAQIYLQIILQQEHRKKWNKDDGKNYLNQAQKFQKQSIKTKKSSILRKTFIQSSHPSASTQYDINESYQHFQDKTKQNYFPSRKTNQNFRTRSRQFRHPEKTKHHHKQIAINKINNFLLQLQEDQICLKNQRKIHLCHLDKLQKHMDQDNQIRYNKIWKDQQKYEEIRKALQRQDQK